MDAFYRTPFKHRSVSSLILALPLPMRNTSSSFYEKHLYNQPRNNKCTARQELSFPLFSSRLSFLYPHHTTAKYSLLNFCRMFHALSLNCSRTSVPPEGPPFTYSLRAPTHALLGQFAHLRPHPNGRFVAQLAVVRVGVLTHRGDRPCPLSGGV